MGRVKLTDIASKVSGLDTIIDLANIEIEKI